jgi:hypothetical protein
MRAASRAALALFALLAVSAAAEAAAPPGKHADRRTQCTARGNAARLEVRCPGAPLADLLGALHRVTGLRSTYPGELAGARVSVTAKNASLADVLKSALAGFNFATWVDERSPSVTQLSIVGTRRGADDSTLSPMAEPAGSPAPERRPSASRQPDRRETRSTAAAATPAASPQQGAPAPSSAPAQAPAALAPKPAPAQEVAAPSAFLLSPPTGGNTPVMPQRAAETPILKPGVPDSAAN